MPKKIYRAKLALIGDQTVGKSTIAQMFVSDGVNYSKNYNMTFCTEVSSKTLAIPDSDDAVELLIYDSPGFEAYKEYLDKFWNKPDLLMIVYDVTNKKTLNSAESWLQRAQEAEWRSPSGNPLTAVLLGNKTDAGSRRACSEQDALHFATTHGMKHFTGSAKEYEGINEAFEYLAEVFHLHYSTKEP